VSGVFHVFHVYIEVMFMTTVNPLSTMLDTAFTKFDRNKDGKLDTTEFQSFYEILKPGIAVDENNKPKISVDAEFKRMDHNGDGGVIREEMQTTGILMPAKLSSDGSLNAMLEYLQQQTSESALMAAKLLMDTEAPTDKA
jgi:hypothetical protein